MADCRKCCKVITVSLVPATAFLLCLAFFAGFIALPTLYTELSYKEQYAIVVDAGSTHSQIFLYSWRLPFYSQTGTVYQHNSCRAPGGGIGTYTNATAAGESLVSCVKAVLKYVPGDFNSPPHHKVKVWVGATAGMRVLKKENESLANDILESVKTSLDNLGTRTRAKILPGQEEALGGWITSNYINGTLNQRYPMKRDMTPMTNGALDMGGASMQIAYETDDLSGNHTTQVDLFGASYDVYARSYLCYGVREAFRRILAYSAMEANYNSSVQNPCVHKGHVLNQNASYLFIGHYCTEELLNEDLPDGMNFRFNGSGDYSQCQDLVQRAMNFSVNVSNGQLIEYQQPRPVGNFFGFSNFYYISTFFGFATLDKYTLGNLEENITAYCSLEWSDVLKKYSDYDQMYLSDYCLDGAYLFHSLTNGFGFSNTSSNDWSIALVQQVDGLDVGWSLGYMLQETKNFVNSKYYTHYPYTAVDLVVGMIVLTLLCVVFLIFFAFTFAACRKSLQPLKSSYTNIA